MSYELGIKVDALTVNLYRDADFTATIDLTGGTWPEGATVLLRFPDLDPAVEWAATLAGASASWAVDKTLTNARSDREKVELWVDDQCWARGAVSRRGA